MNRNELCVSLIATLVSTVAVGTDRDDYNRRSAERFVAMFEQADTRGGNAIAREDAAPSIELTARFDDIDINRDGRITREELMRFIDITFR